MENNLLDNKNGDIIDKSERFSRTIKSTGNAVFTLFVMCAIFLYIKHYVLILNDVPGFDLNELLAFTLHTFVFFLIILLLSYFCYENIIQWFVSDRKIKEKFESKKALVLKYIGELKVLKSKIENEYSKEESGYICSLMEKDILKHKKKIDNKAMTILDHIMSYYYILIHVFIFVVFLIFSLLLSENEEGYWHYLYAIMLFIIYIITIVIGYRSKEIVGRIILIISILAYVEFANINIMGVAGIGNYKADVMVYMNDNVVDYLKERGVDIDFKSCYEDNKSEESNAKKLKICKTTKGNLRLNNIKVLSSIGKKTFLEYNLDDKNKIRLIFNTKQVEILEKFNIPFKTTK